jgi:hypothetical protein
MGLGAMFKQYTDASHLTIYIEFGNLVPKNRIEPVLGLKLGDRVANRESEVWIIRVISYG